MALKLSSFPIIPLYRKVIIITIISLLTQGYIRFINSPFARPCFLCSSTGVGLRIHSKKCLFFQKQCHGSNIHPPPLLCEAASIEIQKEKITTDKYRDEFTNVSSVLKQFFSHNISQRAPMMCPAFGCRYLAQCCFGFCQ